VTLNPLLDAQSVRTDPRHAWIGEVFRTARVIAGFGDEIGAAPYFSDASMLTPALGSPPTAVIGPGELTLAHQTDEYRFVSRIEQTTDIHSRLVQNWCAI
jgi:succinyl-diaminopimelate desuccinylase